MKKFILGVMFVTALLLTGAEPVDGDVCASLVVKLAGVVLLALTAVLFKRWHIADDSWVRDFCDDE